MLAVKPQNSLAFFDLRVISRPNLTNLNLTRQGQSSEMTQAIWAIVACALLFVSGCKGSGGGSAHHSEWAPAIGTYTVSEPGTAAHDRE